MITLRPINPAEDAEALHAIFGSEVACRYLPDAAFKTLAETEAKLSEWLSLAPDTDWAITADDDEKAIGRVTIFEKDGGVWEVGIMTCPSVQGRGIAGAALREAVDRLDRSHRPRRIEADIDPDNTPSLKLFERHGFRTEGILRKRWKTHIGERDTVLLSLIDTDPRPWRRGQAQTLTSPQSGATSPL
ncbi:MAG: GNAT family protein [Pseudomonadota bacterium]